MKKILVPIDFSPNSLNAMHVAAAIARKFNATLELLHVNLSAIYSAPLSEFVAASKYESDDQQYDDFARIAGGTAKMQLDKSVRAPAFQQLPAHLRRDLLNETVKQAREAGRNMIMMKYPQIVRQATQDRLDTLREAPTPIE